MTNFFFPVVKKPRYNLNSHIKKEQFLVKGFVPFLLNFCDFYIFSGNDNMDATISLVLFTRDDITALSLKV